MSTFPPSDDRKALTPSQLNALARNLLEEYGTMDQVDHYFPNFYADSD